MTSWSQFVNSNFSRKKGKFEADVALPAAEKLAKVTEIDRKLAKLARN